MITSFWYDERVKGNQKGIPNEAEQAANQESGYSAGFQLGSLLLARAKEDDSKGDIPGAMTWRAEANVSRHDIAWLKRDTNWRDFESKPYALDQARPWAFVYPAEISTPMPWDTLRRMAATLIEA